MILVRSPLRISLGGGGTDLPSYYEGHGGFLVAGAINKYVYVSLLDRFDSELFVRYSRNERCARVAEIEHPIIRETMQYFGMDVSALEVVTMADLPAGTGLGSSGSFTTALIKAMALNNQEMIQAEQVAQIACEIEIDRLGEPIGKQDQYIAAYGGINAFHFNQDGSVGVNALDLKKDVLGRLQKNLLLFFTGFTRSASNILKDQKERSLESDKSMIENLHFTKELGLRSRKALEDGDLVHFGEIMDIHWKHKKQRSAGMSNSRIDDWYSVAKRAGAIGGKVVGAGGGGFLLFYTEKPEALRSAMLAEGLEEVTFGFDFEGTKVLLS